MAIVTEIVDPHGPLVNVTLNPSEKFAAERRAAGLPMMTPYPCVALVDTGAKMSLIGLEAVAALGLETIGTFDLATPTTGRERKPCRAFAARFTIAIGGRSTTKELAAVESDLFHLGVGAILGRDFLESCLLVYNGPTGEFALAF